LASKKEEKLANVVFQLIKDIPNKDKNKVIQQVLSIEKGELIPISIFNSKLSGLEAITIYLKDERKQSVKQISKLLNRKTSTIYTTYQNAKLKLKKPKLNKQKKAIFDFSITIPISIFSNRKYSILESLVSHLKEKKDLSMTKIAALVNRNYNTIKTVYSRYKVKKDENK